MTGYPAGARTSVARSQVTAEAAVLLTAEEAAGLLRLSRTATFALIGSGELRSVKIGHRRRVPRKALDEYAARLLADASGQATSTPGV